MKKNTKKKQIYSHGYSMVRNNLLDVMKTDKFQKKILSLRKKYKIPGIGYEPEFRKENKILLIPPSKWQSSIKNVALSENAYNDFILETQELSGSLALHHNVSPDPLEAYLFYNILEEPRYGEKSLEDLNLCFIRDVQQDRNLDNAILNGLNEEEKKFLKRRRGDEDRNFPIELRISSYASLTTIKDYLDRAYEQYIIPLQERYAIKGSRLGKIRTKDPVLQQRNEFIFQNQHLPKHELSKLVSDTFYKPGFLGKKESPDYAGVAKIISLENKKRSVDT